MRAIVIGAGPAGLAVAACLKRDGAEAVLLERETCVGSSWRRHYDRLHLHSPKWLSHLPGQEMPADWPRYPSRDQVVDYLEDYAQANDLAPVFGVEVAGVAEDDCGWTVAHSGGVERGDVVVFATGLSQVPFRPEWPGQAGFAGPVVHSSDYRNPEPFVGKRMLVVGFGNSGGEIALDLSDADLPVDIAVRSPVNLLPKELFGRPIQSLGLLQKIFPHRVADRITAPVLRWALGDYTAYGLRRPPVGPVTQIREEGRVPLIDIGTLGAIKAGKISVRPGLERFDGNTVRFVDGTTGEYDGIVLATGYRVDLRPMLGEAPDLLDPQGRPLICGSRAARRGIYFCAYTASPMGQLGQIRMESEGIAADVAALAPVTGVAAG